MNVAAKFGRAIMSPIQQTKIESEKRRTTIKPSPWNRIQRRMDSPYEIYPDL